MPPQGGIGLESILFCGGRVGLADRLYSLRSPSQLCNLVSAGTLGGQIVHNGIESLPTAVATRGPLVERLAPFKVSLFSIRDLKLVLARFYCVSEVFPLPVWRPMRCQ